MSWSPAGTCTKCGAPMYVPMVWHGVIPPSPRRTCNCFPENYSVTTNNTSNQKKSEANDQ